MGFLLARRNNARRVRLSLSLCCAVQKAVKLCFARRTHGPVMDSEFASGRLIFLSILGLIEKQVIKPSVGVGAGSWKHIDYRSSQAGHKKRARISFDFDDPT